MTRTEAIIRRVTAIRGFPSIHVVDFANRTLSSGFVWIVVNGESHSVSPHQSAKEVMQWVTSSAVAVNRNAATPSRGTKA